MSIDTLTAFNSWLSSLVWGPATLVILVGTGLYFTLGARFLQITHFPTVIKDTVGTLFRKKRGERGGKTVSPFQAMSTALAGTMGIGNIAGVSTAITLGGPGAIFWMWVSAFFGMATKYAEVLLAVQYREKNERGQWIGGPMYYMEKGLHSKWLAIIFSVCCVAASFGIGNMTQSNTIAVAVETSFGVPPAATGLVLSAVCGLVIVGGISRIVRVTEKLVPLMSLFYIAATAAILIIFKEEVPGAFSLIFGGAFGFQPAAAGAAGYAVMTGMRFGVARGVFSNEAGLGSAPIVHASAHTDSPVRQGFWGMFEVFADTLVVCTLTALVVLSSGLWEGGLSGAQLTNASFVDALGPIGGYMLTVATVLFALSSILGWSLYGERSLEYLFRGNKSVGIYRLIFLVFVAVGAVAKLSLVWDISDTFNGLMAFPNLIALIFLGPQVLRITKDYFNKDKHRK